MADKAQNGVEFFKNVSTIFGLRMMCYSVMTRANSEK